MLGIFQSYPSLSAETPQPKADLYDSLAAIQLRKGICGRNGILIDGAQIPTPEVSPISLASTPSLSPKPR